MADAPTSDSSDSLGVDGDAVDFACRTTGARIVRGSAVNEPPNDYEALITPLVPGEDPSAHYAAALRPLPDDESEDWFELELPRERPVARLEIDWLRPEFAGVEFVLEYRDAQDEWVECLNEDAGYEHLQADVYRKALPGPVVARRFRFRLARSLGQNRLLIRRFSLWGPGPAPSHVLMLTPDCHMIDRRILQQARSLIEAGHRVTLVAGGECPREEHYFIDSIAVHRYAYDWDDERIRRVRAWIPTPALRNLFTRVFRRLADRLLSFNSFDTFVYRRARALRADVVHVHDLPFLKHGARLAREWRVPLVYDAHEIYYEQESLPPARRRRLRKEEKRYAPRTDLFITVNESIAERFRRAHGDLNYLVLMNCADRVETVDRAASRQRLRAMAELATEDRIVLFQGWISAERNLDTLVRAARHFPGNTYLVFIGYGAYQAELERIVQTEGIERKVRFLGRVEPDEILPLTTGADLGVIPYLPIDLNHRYCSPNKFFEYVQARVPIVAHDLEFFRRMKDLHGVVVTGDLSSPETTADAINGLLNRPERLRELADRCERASAVLNWSSEAEKLLRAYPVSPNR